MNCAWEEIGCFGELGSSIRKGPLKYWGHVIDFIDLVVGGC